MFPTSFYFHYGGSNSADTTIDLPELTKETLIPFLPWSSDLPIYVKTTTIELSSPEAVTPGLLRVYWSDD
jgi:hypothetical protein